MRSKWFWAVVALVAVLGITAAASATTGGLIKGKAIAPHSITSKHLVNHTIQAHDLSPALITTLHGAVGPAGPKGDTGATGPQGPPGPENERIVAQRDAVAGGVTLNFTTMPVINTVTFTAPSAGIVTIIGQAFVNDEGTAGYYNLIPKLDGANVSAQGWVTTFESSGHELFTLNFAISTPVSAGTHTITDSIDGPATDGFINANNLNVVFAPIGSVMSASSASGAPSSSATGR